MLPLKKVSGAVTAGTEVTCLYTISINIRKDVALYLIKIVCGKQLRPLWSQSCIHFRILVYRSLNITKKILNYTLWPESTSELYRPRDRSLSAKSVPTFVDRGCRVVSATDPYCRIFWFLDRSRCFFFQVTLQLYSQGWVDPVPEPLLLRKSGRVGNITQTSGSVARNSDR
jgi:hypothetical protein